MQIDVHQILRQKAPGLARKLPACVIHWLARTIHQEELNDILSRYHDKQGVCFMQELVRYFDLHIETVHTENLPPIGGRYLFVANHPLGGLDGICLAALLGTHYEGKIRYLVNDLLLNLPNLREIFVPINKHGAQGRENACQIDTAYASDNQVITFPAGLCSRRIRGKVQDLPWKKSFIQKAVAYQRNVVPIYFEGHNSSFFYRLAQTRKWLGIRANLEMLYLPDEMFRSKHATFRILIGKPIPWQTFDRSLRPDEWADKVRTITYQLNR